MRREEKIGWLNEFNYVCVICTISNFSGHFHFLQIRLDGSNWHIFPPCFAQMKWKIEGSSGHKHERTLHFFTFFPVIYSTYNGSARKNWAEFSYVCMCGLGQTNFSPSNICLYIIAAVRRGSGQAWRLESTTGIYLPRIGANLAQIGTDGAT